jgi:hypothetical protein
MLLQNSTGEIIMGDSHEYGLSPNPSDKTKINQYIPELLEKICQDPFF